jgi:type VI secretion system protein ImpM
MAAAFGAFGKMPSLGDFFRFGLPADFVSAWDDWLQAGLPTVRAALDDRWQDCYMSAPIWRFACGPGLAGAAAMLGIIMPSVDRVGRTFPLTLAAPLPGAGSPFLHHFAAESAFGELEAISLAALDDTMTRDALAERVTAVAYDPERSRAEVVLADGILTVNAPGEDGALPGLVAEILGRRFTRPSVWSADVGGGTRLMACEGLPDSARMGGLFDLSAPLWSQAGAA